MANPFPDEMDIHTVSPDYKREGSDWYAVFNPKVKRVLDVQLVHNLMHERHVQLSPIRESWKADAISPCPQCGVLRQVFIRWQIPGHWL